RAIGIAAVVVCGGETLGCDATGGLAMNLPGQDAGALLGMPKPWRARALSATVMGAAPFAYVLHPDDILSAPSDDAPLIYHSVGGARLADLARRRAGASRSAAGRAAKGPSCLRARRDDPALALAVVRNRCSIVSGHRFRHAARDGCGNRRRFGPRAGKVARGARPLHRVPGQCR